MEGLYFALSVFAIAIVIRWCLIAEHSGNEYRGLLAMRRPARRPKPPGKGSGSRPRGLRRE